MMRTINRDREFESKYFQRERKFNWKQKQVILMRCGERTKKKAEIKK